jgi:hypothetical protein
MDKSMRKVTLNGADVEFDVEPVGNEWVAFAKYDDVDFRTKAFKAQIQAQRFLEQMISKYQSSKAVLQQERRRLDAWNKGEPRRY